MRGCVSYHVTESSLGKGLIPTAVRYAAAEDVKYVKLCWKLPKKKIGAPGNVGQGWTGLDRHHSLSLGPLLDFRSCVLVCIVLRGCS